MKTNTARIALASGFMMLASAVAGTANALPPSSYVYHYYSDGTYRTIVGREVHDCDGETILTGYVTRFRREITRSTCL